MTPRTERRNIVRALVLTETAGYRHPAINSAQNLLRREAPNHNITIDFSLDLESPVNRLEELNSYDVIVFLITTKTIFSMKQEEAFKKYVEEGGAVVAIHSGMTTQPDSKYFRQLMGARFGGHPPTMNTRFVVLARNHGSTQGLPNSFHLFEEVYNLKKPLNIDGMHVVLSADENSYEGGTNGPIHPVTWTRKHGAVRSPVWVTTLGHVPKSFHGNSEEERFFQRHFVQGIAWAGKASRRSRRRFALMNWLYHFYRFCNYRTQSRTTEEFIFSPSHFCSIGYGSGERSIA